MTNLTHGAAKPNPALRPFGILIGEWKTIGTHPLLPNATFHGHTSFKWMEGGAFIIMHTKFKEEVIPSGIAIFGSDDATGECFMLYSDERKISRKYDVSFQNNVLKWWRNAPGFSQRYTWTITNKGQTIIGKGELSKDGLAWEKDFGQTFTRVANR
jgi:hypothetical protein